MEQIPIYNLLQAVDPTKIKVPICDRFAKLTLSSNKKQQPKCDTPNQQEQPQRQQEKRESVSRDISKQFEGENNENKQNPLLRSESSKETQSKNSAETDMEDLTMERLEVSQDYSNSTHLEDDIELLSQQIASLVVESKPISLSSGSTDNVSVLTELVSTESQRSSTSKVNDLHIVRYIPINVKNALEQESISLNLTPSTDDNLEKKYEMTDDEDEEHEDENEAITISDTSESNHEQEQDVMNTSRLPSTTPSSSNLSLPSLVDIKAERVAAFLRDVSIEQHAMVEQGRVGFSDTVDKLLDNKELDKIQEALLKSRQIATADTESMTPEVYEEVTPKSLLEREKRLKALEEFGEKQQDGHNKVRIYTETMDELHTYKESLNSDQSGGKDIHRLANDQTQDNSVISKSESKYNDNEKTPKIHSNFKTDTPKIEGRKANIELSPNKNKKYSSRRLVNEETIANSIMSDIVNALTQQSISYNCSNTYKTPDKEGKTIANDETKSNSPISAQSTPQYLLTDSDHKQELASFISSSSEINATAPEHSITILETDDELLEQKSPTVENSDDKKLSNSFHKEDSSGDSDYDDDDEQISRIQVPMGSINISAKINIKIHIPNSTSSENSQDDQNCDRNDRNNARSRKKSNKLAKVQTKCNERKLLLNNDHGVETDDQCIESNDQGAELDHPEKSHNKMQIKTAIEETLPKLNKSDDSVEIVEDEKFVTEAEKLLTQLYGKSWQTPEVIRTLKHSTHSSKKSTNSKSFARKNNEAKNSMEKKSYNKSTEKEESILHDFSIFRRNIAKTNLDSTRLATPKSVLQNKASFTEPRNTEKPYTHKKDMGTKLMPQTERKPLGPPVAKVVVNKKGVDYERWRKIIEDDSSSEGGNNATDDDDADESWSKNASELDLENSDTDLESSPRPKARDRKNKITKGQGRSDKSNYLKKVLNKSKEGEIIYLDLSNEEVEVQDEVPESPPANHDDTFASRLQDILKTCRHENKAKLPSSNKNIKRKLFTPDFGNEFNVEDETKAKENIPKTNNKNYYDDEILEDNGNCPFDSLGRTKILDLMNKPLESVKRGKPIFQETPSPIKKGIKANWNDKDLKCDIGNTPKINSDKEAKFKTPATIKSKGPLKVFKELCPTPDYKYSFLKSLDVTVSKTFCHPDALYYRDNYRTKKEDLSRLLYEMYNEKLFKNKLDVPIKWNKKLLNTAGRCLNKMKLGVRSSVVELGDKVLTSADRLRCTLIHELCHAATWIFDGESGHGLTWKAWACRANATFPELPKIGVCHQYDIEYKYTYKCSLCGAKSHAHSKSKKVENIRCAYCHGAIEIFLNKKDKDGNLMPTPIKEPTGFAKFVKDNYKKFKRDDLKHADVMKLLSNEFATLKVGTN